MSFVDMIKNSVIAEFTGTISVDKILLSLAVAFIIGVFIVYVYRKTFSGVVYSKSFSLCIILLAMVTAMIIRTISSNLALSLGMVGALSIVRFRTAIKEPTDTAFMFWSITAGIMAGAGLYIVSVIASLGIGLLYFLGYTMGFKLSRQYLMIIKYNVDVDETILKAMSKLTKTKLKSKSVSKDLVELTFEVELKDDNTRILNGFKNLHGVESVSIISYQNDFGA
ncbi:MAG: DUF4956 domain-containing protein [Firmicutes bacterium]|nr:DUF4956 domain-containing protein [Bacillota bacterium]